MDFQNLSFLEGVFFSLFSVVVVFLVLLIISYMIDLIKILLYRKRDKKDDVKPDDTGPVLREEAPEAVDKADSRTTAIIAAAISTFFGKDSRFVITNISRHKAPLSDWEAAGILDSQRRSL